MNENCRLCRRDCRDLEENIWDTYEGVKVSELVVIICGIKVSAGDRLPKKVCDECLEICISAFQLQKVSRESEKYFEYICEHPVKVEQVNLKEEVEEASFSAVKIFQKAKSHHPITDDESNSSTEPAPRKVQKRRSHPITDDDSDSSCEASPAKIKKLPSQQKNNIEFQKNSNRRRSFTVKEKLDVLDLLNFPYQGFNSISRTTSISSKCIRTWYAQRDELLAMVQNGSDNGRQRKRLFGSGLKPRFENLEEKLADFVREQIKKEAKVTDKLIVAQSKRIRDVMVKEMETSSGQLSESQIKIVDNLKSFVASHSWFQKFMQRNNFTLRQRQPAKTSK